jgi:DNA (cytosine-5)-methyltransferase 1
MLTCGDLFSGIGGFSLGLERTGYFRTAWFAEVDPYASAVLKKHWPEVPNFGDVRSISAERLRAYDAAAQVKALADAELHGGDHGDKRLEGSAARNIEHGEALGRSSFPDVLCGGFPCQDISNAGKRVGIDGERSGLWSEYARIIGELRPRFVIIENVAALLSGRDGVGDDATRSGVGTWMGRVLGDLAALGFDAEWHCIPASAVGAPHRRDRVWIIDSRHRECGRSEPQLPCGYGARARPEPCDRGAHVADGGRDGLDRGAESHLEAHEGRGEPTQRRSDANGRDGRVRRFDAASESERRELRDGRLAQSPLGLLAHGIPADLVRWSDEPEGVPRVAQGIENRVDQLRCLGNAIVPRIAEVIGRAIVRAA